MNKLLGYVATTLVLVLGLTVLAQVGLTTFEPGSVIRAAEVNANFRALADALGAKQDRVEGSCEVGSFVTAIGADGSVECGEGGGGGGGDVTAVSAGAGLTGGGVAGDLALEVDFAGTGSADTVARSDHDHDGRYPTGAEVDARLAALDFGFEVVERTGFGFTIGPGSGAGFGLGCPGGKRVLNVGWDIESGLQVVENRPQGGTSWFFAISNVSGATKTGNSDNFKLYLTCADLP